MRLCYLWADAATVPKLPKQQQLWPAVTKSKRGGEVVLVTVWMVYVQDGLIQQTSRRGWPRCGFIWSIKTHHSQVFGGVFFCEWSGVRFNLKLAGWHVAKWLSCVSMKYIQFIRAQVHSGLYMQLRQCDAGSCWKVLNESFWVKKKKFVITNSDNDNCSLQTWIVTSEVAR